MERTARANGRRHCVGERSNATASEKGHLMIATCKRVLAITGLVLTAGAWAQNYPDRPVKVIVPYQAGGSADTLIRIVGQRLSELWSQQLVVENRAGASSIIGTELAAKSAPDGYTLYLATDTPIVVNPSLFAKLPYDWKRDFTPVSLLATLNQVLIVHPSVQARNVQELIALARQKPGQLNYASMGVGSSPHLAAEQFKSLANVEITHVPYKGSPQSITALLAGEVSMFFVGESTAAPHVKAGKLRALGTTGKNRSEVYPDVPTIGEGVPGFEMGIWFGVFAPARLPDSVLRKLNADLVKALEAKEVRTALAARGFDAKSSSPEEFRVLVERDQDRWAALIRQIGIKPQ